MNSRRYTGKSSAFIALLFSLLLTFVLWFLADRYITDKALNTFEHRAIKIQSAMNAHMVRHAELLFGTVSLFKTADDIDRQTWSQYVYSMGLWKRYKDIQGIGFLKRVEYDEKDQHIQSLRDEGFTFYDITPAGVRPEYYPLYFIEPLTDFNIRSLGFDLMTLPTSQVAITRARDTGDITMSARIVNMDKSGKGKLTGLLMYLPVYTNDAPVTNIEQRRQALKGLVISQFRIDTTIQDLITKTGMKRHDVDVRIYNSQVFSEDSLLYDSRIKEDKNRSYQATFIKQLPFLAGNSNWNIIVSSTPVYDKSIDYSASRILLIASIITSILFAFFISLRVRSRVLLADTNTTLLQEVNERKLAEKALLQEKERAEITLNSIGDAVIRTDGDGNVDYMNPTAETLTGWSITRAKGYPLSSVFIILDEENLEHLPDPVELCLKENSPIELANNIILINPKGRKYSIEISAAPIRDSDKNVTGVVLAFSDITEKHRLAEQMNYQATHDVLTGLINHHEFENRLIQVIEETRNMDIPHTMLYLNLDQFKIVNETCDRAAGDEILRQVSARLQSKIRKHDILARLGNDDFGILLENCTQTQALDYAEMLRHLINDSEFIWDENTFTLTVSIGLVSINIADSEATNYIVAANSACYAAKEKGRNRTHIYQPDDLEIAQRHGEMKWISRISKAIKEDRLCLYLQDITSLSDPDGPQHGEILVRMIDESGKLIPPSAFIAAAERYERMIDIDQWVVHNVFSTMGKRDPTDKPRLFSFNISGLSLSNKAFLDFVIDEINHFKIDTTQICFEITETAAIADVANARRFIAALKNIGCQFSLDDFGSGLSSFAYLKNLPVDYLKIDGVFVRDMVNDPIDYAMIESINQIGHVMGIKTIAEYVENDEILNQLKHIGVDYVQGYHISKPKPWFI